MILTLLALFLFAFVSEVTWTVCVKAVQKDREIMASTGAALHALCVLSATWIVVEARTLPGVAAYTAGVFIGAYVVVRRLKK